MSDLPPLDPAVGSEANEQAAQARRDAEQALSEGKMTLEALFSAVDNERNEQGHRIYGHMHLRAALLALPHIGEKKADEILQLQGFDHNTRLDQIGSNQRQVLLENVSVES